MKNLFEPVRVDEVKQRIAPVFASLGQAMKALAGRYNKAEWSAIEDYLERITRLLHEQTARLSADR